MGYEGSGRDVGNRLWQRSLLEALSDHLAHDPEVRALIAAGSLVSDDQVDLWSDIDLKVVVDHGALARYFPDAAWLAPFGTLLGAERHDGALTKTLRVSLVGHEAAAGVNRRLDLVFVPASALADSALWDQDFIPQDCTVLWSRLPAGGPLARWDAATGQAEPPPAPETTGGGAPPPDVTEMVDAFWFKAVVAIGKVMRHDHLIGGHLALDLARDCLVLQMMRRDRQLGTTIHRAGGWGNEILADVWPTATTAASGTGGAGAILDLIERCATAFDALATMLAPAVRPRAGLLQPSIDAARAQLNEDGA